MKKACTWKETGQHGKWTTTAGGEAETTISVSLQHTGSIKYVKCKYIMFVMQINEIPVSNTKMAKVLKSSAKT